MTDEIKWKDEDCEYHGHASGRIMRSEIGTGDFFRTSYDEGARAMLAELTRRGEEIERLDAELSRSAQAIGGLVLESEPPPQLDGKAIGVGFKEALLPGMTLGPSDVVNLTEILGTAIGRGMKRDTTP